LYRGGELLRVSPEERQDLVFKHLGLDKKVIEDEIERFMKAKFGGGEP
jgi:hypothetical protein